MRQTREQQECGGEGCRLPHLLSTLLLASLLEVLESGGGTRCRSQSLLRWKKLGRRLHCAFLSVSTAATATTASTSATPVDDSGHWWLYGIAAAAALTLLVLVVVLVRWRRLKGRRAQVQKKLTSDLSASPADPESGHDTENPGEELCYSSVTYNKKNHSNKVKGHEDDEVTYSTVKSKASPSDKCNLYASISKN